jgi:hypothetical protein
MEEKLFFLCVTMPAYVTRTSSSVAVESVESCYEKWEASSRGKGQLVNLKEGEYLLLEATTEQLLVKTEKVLHVL